MTPYIMYTGHRPQVKIHSTDVLQFYGSKSLSSFEQMVELLHYIVVNIVKTIITSCSVRDGVKILIRITDYRNGFKIKYTPAVI